MTQYQGNVQSYVLDIQSPINPYNHKSVISLHGAFGLAILYFVPQDGQLGNNQKRAGQDFFDNPNSVRCSLQKRFGHHEKGLSLRQFGRHLSNPGSGPDFISAGTGGSHDGSVDHPRCCDRCHSGRHNHGWNVVVHINERSPRDYCAGTSV